MRTTIIAAALVAALVTPAIAHADSMTTTCYHSRHGGTCTTRINPDPKPITYTAEEIAQMKARDDEWATYCKPHDAVGSDGLLRAVYAHKDCDIGHYVPGQRGE